MKYIVKGVSVAPSGVSHEWHRKECFTNWGNVIVE